MLMTGNYRCIGPDAAIPIKEAVHANLETSRGIYDWVWTLCAGLGADDPALHAVDSTDVAREALAALEALEAGQAE